MAARFDLDNRGAQWASAISPIYAQREDGELEAVGTGIFFEHRGRAFVFTASHVLTAYDNARLLIGGDHLFVLVAPGQPYFPAPDEDVYDVGFVPLTSAQRECCVGVRFLTIGDCARPAHEPRPHYLVGYRAAENEGERSVGLVTSRWRVYGLRSAENDAYVSRGLEGTERLLLTFDRRLLWDGEGQGAETEEEPEGMSGCGVVQISNSESDDRLTAIVESHTDTGKLIYASSLGPLLEQLEIYIAGGSAR